MQGLKGVVIVATIVAATIALGGCFGHHEKAVATQPLKLGSADVAVEQVVRVEARPGFRRGSASASARGEYGCRDAVARCGGVLGISSFFSASHTFSQHFHLFSILSPSAIPTVGTRGSLRSFPLRFP